MWGTQGPPRGPWTRFENSWDSWQYWQLKWGWPAQRQGWAANWDGAWEDRLAVWSHWPGSLEGELAYGSLEGLQTRRWEQTKILRGQSRPEFLQLAKVGQNSGPPGLLTPVLCSVSLSLTSSAKNWHLRRSSPLSTFTPFIGKAVCQVLSSKSKANTPGLILRHLRRIDQGAWQPYSRFLACALEVVGYQRLSSDEFRTSAGEELGHLHGIRYQTRNIAQIPCCHGEAKGWAFRVNYCKYK